MLTALLLLSSGARAEPAKVRSVIDGRTLELESGEQVRLIGLDDSADSGTAEKAAEFVKGLGLKGEQVKMEFDAQKRDKHGRLLAYVYFDYCKGAVDCFSAHYFVFPFLYKEFDFPVENEGDVFINGTIIKAGYAPQKSVPPNMKYAQLFLELHKEARNSNRGLWKVVSQEECEDLKGRWQIISMIPEASPDCNFSTKDAGKRCTDSSQCESYCQAREGAKVGANAPGECYGWSFADCMQEVREGEVLPEWCY